MNSLVEDPELRRIYEPYLFVSDSNREYTLLGAAVEQQLGPRDFIEHILAAELIEGEGETLRLRRFKSKIVAAARLPALRNLLTVLLENSNSDDVNEFAERYFTNKGVRRKIERLLRDFGLTEANIDAEAFRHSLNDLGQINRRLTELASRRDKLLQLFEEHRAALAVPCSSKPLEENKVDSYFSDVEQDN